MSPVPGFRLGLVGAGRWGRNLLATAGTLPEIRLAAVASANPGTAALVPPGCVTVPDWRTLLAEIPLDGVCLAVPAARQPEIALAALAAGLPVMAEKPLALSVDATGEVVAAARAAGLPLLVDFIHLFNPAYRALRAHLTALGPIRRIESVGGGLGPFRADCPPLWDYGAHDLALCLDLLRRPATQLSACRRERRQTAEGLGEILRLDLGFGDGVEARIETGNLMQPKTRRLTVWAGAAMLLFDDLSPTPLTAIRDDGPPETLPVSGPRPLAAALAAFVAMASARRPDWSTADLALDVAGCLARADRELGR